MKTIALIFLSLFTCSLFSVRAEEKDLPKLSPDNIKEIISLMTIEEKAAMVVGTRSKQFDGVGNTNLYVPGAAGTTRAIERLGIPAIVLADGPAGVRIKGRPCTKFPIGTCLSSTWNPALVSQVGAAIGNEVKEYGVDVLLAPGANLHRNPLCGRNFEYYSEDPVLTGEIAASYINGVQSQGVGTSLKHFAVNSQELNRLFLDARAGKRTLRELYLKNFEIAVKKSSPWTIMTAYNYINGIYAAENHDLATRLLRDEWGYEGAVMTDWSAGYDGTAIVASGNDMIQPGNDRHYERIVAALKDGSLPMEVVDTAVERILRLVVKSPRFSGYAYSNQPALKENAQVALAAAKEGAVLLKNANATLPFAAKDEIALFGVASYDFITGGTGSGDVNGSYTINMRQGLLNSGFALNQSVDAFYEDYMKYEDERCAVIDKNGHDNKWYIDAERPMEAVPYRVVEEAAKTADKAVITIGRVFGEGKDRSYDFSYCLTEPELKLIKACSQAFHKEGKSVVVVLDVGGIVEMTSWRDLVDAVLISWLPGCEAGNAIAALLSGAENPSGRLPMTISYDYKDDPTAGDIPQYLLDKPYNYSFYRRNLGDDFKKRYEIPNIDYVNYDEGVFMGYRYYSTNKVKTAYPFGFGLSYTNFAYSNMTVQELGENYVVNVTVSNKGKCAGKEVVQLYVSAPGKDMEKPVRELKAFAKTALLQPGESVVVEMTVPKASLASYDENRNGWAVEKGNYQFIAAKNVEAPVCKSVVKIKDATFTPTLDLFSVDPLFIEE